MRLNVEKLFHEVADLSADARARYFAANAVAPQTRNEVEALVAFDSYRNTALESDIGDLAQRALEQLKPADSAVNQLPGSYATADSQADPNEHCGPYRLIRRLGRGGMGEVWLAERVDGIMKRPVALKLPFTEYGSHLEERAHREREILAGLSHPGIARLYDAGLAATGRPYLALEYVEGVTITDYCDQQRLTVRERLKPFLDVLSAVQYAHSRLVIHRDLKPSNILVTADGEVKLLDFGIAKLMQEGEARETALTHVAGRPFTPDYASPEQAAGRDITTASDVYSLGMVLYELLCGERPYQVNRGSWTPVEQLIESITVRAPSQVAGRDAAAQARSTMPAKLAGILRGDLDTIVMKALYKEPERRYQTVDAFRADIERYLAGDAVMARPASRWYRTNKFLRRHRWAVSSTAAVFVALAAGLGVALWEAQEARREARTSAAVQEFIQDIFRANSRNQPDPVKAQKTTARELLNLGAQKIEAGLSDAPAAKIKMLSILADSYADLGMDDQEVDLLKRRVALIRRESGGKGRALALALADLGQGMQASRSVNEREKVLSEAKRLLDREGDYTSSARAELCVALAQHYSSSNVKQALQYAQQAVRLLRSLGPPKDLAEALFQEAELRRIHGEMETAASLYAEAVTIARTSGGDRNPVLPRYYAMQGETLQYLMRFNEAEDRLRLAYQASVLMNGEDHVDSTQTGSRLGIFLVMGSRYGEGLPYLEKALAATIRTRGASDPFYVPQMLFSYGMALHNYGRWEDSLVQVSLAVDNRRKNRPGTLFLAQMLEQQASTLIELGQYGRAASVLEDVLEIGKHAGQAPDLAWAAPQIHLAMVTGRVPEAVALMEQYCGEPAPANLSFPYLRKLMIRADVRRTQGNFIEAARVAARLTSEILASPGRSYLRIWEMRSALVEGEARLGLRDPRRARPLLEHALELSQAVLDPNSAETASIQIALANCDLDLGRRDAARMLASEAQGILGAHRQLGDHLLVPMRKLMKRVALPGDKEIEGSTTR